MASRNPRSYVVIASRSRPWTICRSAMVMAPPTASKTNPAFAKLDIPSEYQRYASSRAPVDQYASPRRAAADPRSTGSSSPTSSSALRAWVIVRPIAEEVSQSGPVEGDSSRQTAERLFVDDHSLRARFSRCLPIRRRCVQPPFGVSQARFDALDLAPGDQAPDIPDNQHGPDPDHLVWQSLQPVVQSAVMSGLTQRGHRQLDQLRGSVELLAGQRVADRLGPLAVLLAPVARPPVQLSDVVRLLV